MVLPKTRPVIISGFALILLIFITFVVVWFSTSRLENKRLLTIEKYREIAERWGDLRQAALRRSVLLHEMTLGKDFFDRDDKYQEFRDEAGKFIDARNRLLALDPSIQNSSQWNEIRNRITSNEKGQGYVARLILDGQIEKARKLLSERIVPEQRSTLDLVSKTLKKQRELVTKELILADQAKRRNELIVSALGIIAFLISLGIIITVTRTTTRIQQDLRKADEARIANQMKSEFLANMSHEIRTPLTSIIGYSEAALSSNQNEKERIDGIKRVIRNGKHLLQIINDILDLSKVEAGKLGVELLPIDTLDILQDISDLMYERSRKKNIEWNIKLKSPVPEIFNSDPVRLRQILINLCNNAIKFTEKGYITVDVSCNPANQKIIFEVKDTGIGIPRDKQESIFEAFSQAEKSTSRKYGGTGLGLTLSRRLAEMLGGKLEVTSKEGKGSTFTLTISTGPLDQARFVQQTHDITRKSDTDDDTTGTPNLHGNVLLVEDVEDNQILISFYIRKSGASVEIASNGQQALELLNYMKFDLIFMDMQMPVMDGITATVEIRNRGIETPIVALTANAYTSDRLSCEQAGANGFLTKPVDYKKLHETLATYLRRSQRKTDKDEICTTLELDDPVIVDIVNRFIKKLPEKISRLGSLISNQDWDALKTLLHELKGATGNTGLLPLSVIIIKMEFQIQNEKFNQLPALHLELEQLLKRLKTCKPLHTRQSNPRTGSL